jgi:hypothetical protein
MNLLEKIKNNIVQRDLSLFVRSLGGFKHNELIYLRSHIVCEALKIRIEVLKKYYDFSTFKTLLPNCYKTFFFEKLFELKGKEINVPPEFFTESYLSQNRKESLFLEGYFAKGFFEEGFFIDKTYILNESGIDQNLIFLMIRDNVSNKYEGLLHKPSDYIINDVDYLSKNNNSNLKLFYPIIILDIEYKSKMISLLNFYYNLINDDKICDSKKFITDKKVDNSFHSREFDDYQKKKYPGRTVLDNHHIIPVFEKILEYESGLVTQILFRYTLPEYADLLLNKGTLQEFMLHLFHDDDIQENETKIQRIILDFVRDKNNYELEQANLETTKIRMINDDLLKKSLNPEPNLPMNPHIKTHIGDDVFSIGEITLTILSEDEVEIKIRRRTPLKLNYSDFGFSRVRGGKKTKLKTWETLLDLTRHNITAKIDKNRTRINRLNSKLQEQFKLKEEFFELKKQSDGKSIYEANFTFNDRFFHIKTTI